MITTDQLKETVKFYKEQGYCVVENVLSKKECDWFLKESERIAEKQNSTEQNYRPHRFCGQKNYLYRWVRRNL